METVQSRILAVISALDTICIAGTNEQRKLVACADYLKETVKMMQTTQTQSEAKPDIQPIEETRKE